MFWQSSAVIPAHTPGTDGASRAPYLRVSLVAHSASDFAGAACNRRRSRGSADASHRQPYSWRRARAHRGVPKRCSVFGTVCLSRVIGPSVTSCLSSSRNIGSTSSTKVVQVPCRSSHDAGAITLCGGGWGGMVALGGGVL